MEKQSSRCPQSNGSPPESNERAWLEAVVEKVVGASYEVSNVLGGRFPGKTLRTGAHRGTPPARSSGDGQSTLPGCLQGQTHRHLYSGCGGGRLPARGGQMRRAPVE